MWTWLDIVWGTVHPHTPTHQGPPGSPSWYPEPGPPRQVSTFDPVKSPVHFQLKGGPPPHQFWRFSQGCQPMTKINCVIIYWGLGIGSGRNPNPSMLAGLAPHFRPPFSVCAPCPSLQIQIQIRGAGLTMKGMMSIYYAAGGRLTPSEWKTVSCSCCP